MSKVRNASVTWKYSKMHENVFLDVRDLHENENVHCIHSLPANVTDKYHWTHSVTVIDVQFIQNSLIVMDI